MDDDIPYLLLTPGPLTTSRRVRQSMLQDCWTWGDEYHAIVTSMGSELVQLAGGQDTTAVLMQGSGTFSVEATLTTAVPRSGRVLVVNNGAYGKRMVEICRRLGIDCHDYSLEETQPVAPSAIEEVLRREQGITHVAVVHCETTTGLLNPVESLGKVVKAAGLIYIVDAMSSFGGLPMTMESTHADFLVSSANKCIQGVPGFGFVVARRAALVACEGQARSLSLDLFDQWREMEQSHGKWRFTSPTHVVRAFATALEELREEGGVAARHARYCE
ncbi:MAG: 2-aminoethylphosphonate--pyruvate transaminase, partial [Planctomycetales bacterium]|nr:2-aminoethylphosphonate--pyruvate transaminase [Planctomycetales bacterium]